MESLNVSELGTKAHWDQVYQRERQAFHEAGDEGDVWFGRGCERRVLRWIEANVSKDASILDVGCGNGHFLIGLHASGFRNIQGMDYSFEAIIHAKDVLLSHSIVCNVLNACPAIGETQPNVIQVSELECLSYISTGNDSANDKHTASDVRSLNIDDVPENSNQKSAFIKGDSVVCSVLEPVRLWSGNLLERQEMERQMQYFGSYSVFHDKGTFDAICLSGLIAEDAAAKYVAGLRALSQTGGRECRLVITSCNWTREELLALFLVHGMMLLDEIQHPLSFTFGGRKGQTVTSLVFLLE